MDLEECNIKMPSENDRYYVAVVNSERGSVDHTLHCTGMDALCILSGLCGQTIKALIRDCNLPESEAIRLIEAARLTGIDLWKSKKERNGLV